MTTTTDDANPWAQLDYTNTNAKKLFLMTVFDPSANQKIQLGISQRNPDGRPTRSEAQWAYLDGTRLIFFTIGYCKGSRWTDHILSYLREVKHTSVTDCLCSLDRLSNTDVDEARELGVRVRSLFTGSPPEAPVQKLKQLSEDILVNLMIPVYNPPGRTPLGSQAPPTPPQEEIIELLEQAGSGTNRDYASNVLREMLICRDGDSCLLSDFDFDVRVPEVSYILPYALSKPGKHAAIEYLEMFWDQPRLADFFTRHCNQPFNTILLESGIAPSFHNLRWGIEARWNEQSHAFDYIFRSLEEGLLISKGRRRPPFAVKDGDCLPFGANIDPNDPAHADLLQDLPSILPNPEYCNLRLAVSRVVHASGAAGFLKTLFGPDGFFTSVLADVPSHLQLGQNEEDDRFILDQLDRAVGRFGLAGA